MSPTDVLYQKTQKPYLLSKKKKFLTTGKVPDDVFWLLIEISDERQGKTPKASPITPEQIEIRELKKNPQLIEMENERLKKAIT
ncbi:hypothetical protein O2E79_01315, partial [Escherichia coli]